MAGPGVPVRTHHRLLDQLLCTAERAVKSDSGLQARDACLEFLHCLETHLDMEEERYFPALRACSKELAAEVDQLQREHEQFRDMVESIEFCLEAGDLGLARQRLAGLAIRIRQHEAHEEHLLDDLEAVRD